MPAPAMITFTPRPWAPAKYAAAWWGVRWADSTVISLPMPSSSRAWLAPFMTS
jgi:hypothetical protein